MSAPLPPLDLASRDPVLITIEAGEILHRFFTAAYDPIHFNCGHDGRLNAPDGSYGVLYTAKEARGAFAETFLRVPGRTLIPSDLLAKKAYVQLRVTRPLVLIKLGGLGLARLGATAEVVHGGLPYDVPQSWSAALREHPVGASGIAYYARHDDEALCYALYDHESSAVVEGHREISLDEDWFWDLAEPYGVGLAP